MGLSRIINTCSTIRSSIPCFCMCYVWKYLPRIIPAGMLVLPPVFVKLVFFRLKQIVQNNSILMRNLDDFVAFFPTNCFRLLWKNRTNNCFPSLPGFAFRVFVLKERNRFTKPGALLQNINMQHDSFCLQLSLALISYSIFIYFSHDKVYDESQLFSF